VSLLILLLLFAVIGLIVKMLTLRAEKSREPQTSSVRVESYSADGHMSTYYDDYDDIAVVAAPGVNQPVYQNERRGQEPASAADVELMKTGYLQLVCQASVEDDGNSYTN